MDKRQIFDQVQKIFRDVFDNQSLAIKPEMNSADIEDWDSLAQINLVVAMEKEFSLSFKLAEIQALDNIGGMVDLIERKVNEKL
jgi:acyl carrier protein